MSDHVTSCDCSCDTSSDCSCTLPVYPPLLAKTLQMVHERMEEGCVYQVVPFNGKLVASVNSTVRYPYSHPMSG